MKTLAIIILTCMVIEVILELALGGRTGIEAHGGNAFTMYAVAAFLGSTCGGLLAISIITKI